MPRPKIAVLYVGGSIGMVSNQKTGRIDPIETLGEIHRFLPEVQREVALDLIPLSNVGSSEITPDHWIEIAQTIEHHYDKYEGFVVIHGTNTMSYTAAAVSFALQNLSKPVVFTGSLLPINDMGSDGRLNLVYAIRTAQMDIAEVCIALGPRVLRGCRAEKAEQSIMQAFDSPKFPPLAEFNTTVQLHPWRAVRRKRTLSCKPTFDRNVMSVTLHPGMDDRFLRCMTGCNPSGIVLRAYGLGMLPERLFPWLRQLNEINIPVLIVSQLLRGAVDLQRYRKQLTLEQLGVISGKNMTTECAIVKFMWAITQTKNPTRLRELMERSLVGELDE